MTSGLPDARERTPPLGALVRFFGSVDLRSLALLRIALGLVLSVDLIARLRLVDTLYSNDGVLSNHFSLFRPLAPFQFSLYVAASSTRDVTVVFWLTLLVYLLFTVGYRTRLFHVLSFILVTSLHARNLLAELPSDVPLHLLLAWSLVLPLGARFSIDSVRKSLNRVHERSADELNVRVPAETTFTSIAVFGMILQVSIMHLVPALRQNGTTWSDGSALYYALHQNLWVTDLGAWVGEHVPYEWIVRMTFAFRAMEFAVAALVLVPVWQVRRVAFVFLAVFHLASRALLDMGPYEWVMLAALPLFVTSRDWDAVVGWYARKKPALTVYFDGDCGICLATSRFTKRLDSLERLTFAVASSEAPVDVQKVAAETIVARNDASGKTFTESRAFAEMFASLTLGKPLSLLLRAPGVSTLADRAYRAISRNRTAISVWFGYDACGVPQEGAPAAAPDDDPIPELRRGLRVLRETAAAYFLVLCAAALALRMNDESRPHGIEAALYSMVSYPRLFQDWKLFAPDPPRRQGMLVVDAQSARGAKVDPLTGQLPLEALDPARPDNRSRPPSPLLASYFTAINRQDRVIYVDEMKAYVQKIGDQREAGDKLSWFNVNWIEAPILLPSERGVPASPAGPDVPASLVPAPTPARRITSRP